MTTSTTCIGRLPRQSMTDESVVTRLILAARRRSGGPAADQPYGHGDEQHGQRQQPATLDPLEWPEPAGWLVAGQLRVAVLGEALREGSQRGLGEGAHGKGAALLEETVGRVSPPEERERAAPGPPLAVNPG